MATAETTETPLRAALHEALRLWHRESEAGNPLEALQLFHDARRPTDSPRLTANRVLLNALERLRENHPEDAELLRARFLDRDTVYTLAATLNISETTIYARQNSALNHLTELVAGLEEEARASRRALVESRLPPPSYEQLVGVEGQLETLRVRLLADGPPWILALTGIGGIGKSSLSHFLMLRMIAERHFDDFGWVSAQRAFLDYGGAIRDVDSPALTVEALVRRLGAQLLGDLFASETLSEAEKMAALEARLKERRHLIVVDNLETLPDVETLLPALGRFANPSCFVLTSRLRLAPQPGLWQHAVSPLSEENALRFARQEAGRLGLTGIRDAGDDTLRPLYETVGGNPLAIRIVIGHSYYHGLVAVLEELRGARGSGSEALYSYIYRQAWEKLDEPARRVLLAMPLVSDGGGDIALLEATSGMEARDLRPAVERLVRLNLVDAQGDGLEARRYSIHNLTRTFLHEEVLKWD